MYTVQDLITSLNYFFLAETVGFYAALITFGIGLIGNTISIIIYQAKPFRKQSIRVYYTAYGVVETLFLLSNVVFVLQPKLWLPTDFYCKSFLYSQSILQLLCPWILVLASIDRIFIVFYPSRFLFTRKLEFQVLSICVVFAFFAIYFIPQIFLNSQIEQVCILQSSTISYIYGFLTLCLYSLLPFAIMVTTTVVIGLRMRKTLNIVQKISRRKNEEHQFTRSIIGTNLYFLAVSLPYSVVSLVVIYYRTFDILIAIFYGGQLVLAFNCIYSLVALYHATSFFTNIVCNRIFRQIFVDFILNFVEKCRK